MIAKSPKLTITTLMLLGLVASPISAFADASDMSRLQSVVDQLQNTVRELQATVNQQNAKIRTLENNRPTVTSAPRSVEGGISEEEFNGRFDDRLKEKIGRADKWLKDLNFKGDLRLRYEGSDRTDGPGKADDRNRFRYRLRFGWDKKFYPSMKAGFSLASQTAHDEATSTNTTLDDSFSFKPVSIETAYVTYKPIWAEFGPITEVEITGGKFKNPFEEGSSKIIWDRDVRPEGFYEKITAKPIDTPDVDIYVYGIAGQLILEEAAGGIDSELWAWQVGVKPSIDVGMTKPIESKHVFSYYNYSDFANLASDNGTVVTRNNPSAVVTNTMGGFSAEDFDIVEVYNEVKITPFDKRYPIQGYFDWAANIQNGALTVSDGEHDKAWAFGIKLGKAKERNTWELGYEYRFVGSNAVVGQFADSDFGFANKRGSVFKGAYALTDQLTASITGFFTNNITADSGAGGLTAANTVDEETRLFLVDLMWKF